MKKLLTLLFCFFTVHFVMGQASNDDCADAVLLCNGVTENGSTKNATVEGADPNICGGAPIGSIWYYVTAFENGTTTITVENVVDATGFEVQVYSGACGALTSIRACKTVTSASNINGGAAGDDSLQFSVASGSSYYIMVDVSGATRADNADNLFSISASNSILGRPNAELTFTDGKDTKCAGDTFFISNSSSTLYGGTISWYIEANEADGSNNYLSWTGTDTAVIVYAPPTDPFYEFGIRAIMAECDNARSTDTRPFDVLGVNVTLDTVAPVCKGTPVNFVAEAELSDPDEPIDILNWIWVFEDGGVTTRDTIDTNANPDTTQYTPTSDTVVATLTVQSVACLDSSVVDTIPVGDQFTVNVDPATQMLCFGETGSVLCNPDLGVGQAPFSYAWTTTAVAPDRTDSVGINVSGLAVGGPYQYNVRVTDNRGCLGFDTAYINVPNVPTLDTAWVTSLPVSCQNDTGFCVGTDVTFNYTLSGGTSPFTMKVENGDDIDSTSVIVGAVNVDYTVTNLTEADTITVSVTDANGCVDTLIFTLPVQPLPTIVTTPICISNNPPSGDFCITGTCNNSTYLWTGLTSGLVTTTGLYDSCGTVDFTGQAAGDYEFNVTVTDSVTGCIDAITDSFTVSDTLDVALLFDDTLICQDSCVDLEVISPGGGVDLNTVTFTWTPAQADTNVYQNACPSGDSTIYVRATQGSCVYVDSVELEFVATPAPLVTSVMDSICMCDTLTLSGVGSPAGATITYDWAAVNGTVINNDSIVAKIEMCAADTFTFTVTNTNGGCTNTIRDTTKVIAIPTAVASSSIDSLCLNAPTAVVLLGVGSSNTINVHTFSWTSNNPSASINNADKITATVTIDTATTFYLVVTDTVLDCSAIDSVKVSVYDRTQISSDPGFFCSSEPTKISILRSNNYGAGSTFDWSESTDAAKITNPTNEDSARVDLAGFGVGTYDFRLIVDNATSGCKDTNDITLEIVNSLVMSTNFTTDSTCWGDSISVIASAPGAETWSWVSVGNADSDVANNGRDTTTTITVSPIPNGVSDSTYVYRVFATLGSCRDSLDVTLVSLPLPVTNVLDTAFCLGGSATIANHTSNPGDIFVWSPATNLDNNGIANPTSTPTTSRDYALLYMDQYGCISRDTANITVYGLPSITLTSRTSQAFTSCNGSGYCDNMYPIQLEYDVTGGAMDYTIAWTPNDDISNNNHNVAISHNTDTALVTSDTTISYKAIVTDDNGCLDSATHTLTMINYTASQTPVCETDNPPTSTFTVNENCLGATYDWTASGLIDSILTQTNPTDEFAVANFIGLASATYSFAVGVNDVSGCIDTVDFDFNIGSLFTTSFFPYTGPLCNGDCDSLRISIAGDTSGAVITVRAIATDDTIGANLKVYALEVCPTVDTDYELTVTKSGCTMRDTVTVTVVDPPVNSYGGTPDTMCINTPWTFDGSGSATGVGVTYSWVAASGDPITSDDEIMAARTMTTSDTITFTVADANCSVDSTRTIHINLLPAMSATFTPDSICEGERTTVNLDGTGSQVGGSTVYSWTLNPSELSIVDNSVINTNADINQATTVTYEVSDAITGCSDDTTMFIPTYVKSYISGSSGSFCMADNDRSATLTIEGEGGGSTYDWSITSLTNQAYITTVGPWNGESIDVDVVAGGEGTFTFQCVVGNSRSSCDDTISYNIVVLSSPATVITANKDTICYNDTAELVATGSVSYLWDIDPDDVDTTGQTTSDTMFASPAPDVVIKKYTYTVIGAVGSCRDTVTKRLTVLPVIAVDAGSDQSICLGDSVQIGGAPTGNPAYDFTWLPNDDIDDNSLSNPTVFPNSTREYVVTVTDLDGCSDNDSVIVTVFNPPSLVYNTVTTPFVDCNMFIGYCSEEPVEINYSASGGSGVYTFTWDTTLYLRDHINGAWDGTFDQAFIDLDSTITYTVTLSDDVTGCYVEETNTYGVLAPTVTSTDLCVIDNPQTSTFTVSNYCAGATFDWSFSPNDTLLNVTNSDVVVADFTGLGAGDYDFIVVVNDPIKSCDDSIPFTFTLEQPLVNSLGASSIDICRGREDTIAVTGDINDVQFTWVNLTTGDTLPDTTAQIIQTMQASTMFKVIQYRFGCIRMDSIVVNVRSVPTVNVSVVDSVCKCTNISLDATGTDPGFDYLWESTAGNTIVNATSLSGVTMDACNSDSIHYTVTNPANGCFTDTFVLVTSNPFPHAELLLSKDSICAGVMDTISLNATRSYGVNYTMEWDISAGTLSDPSSDNPWLYTDTFTTITLTLTEKISGCDSIVRDTIFLYEFSSFGSTPDTVCAEGVAATQICLPDTTPGTTYDWTMSPDVLLIGGATNEACINIPLGSVGPGAYNFGVAVFNANSACADTLYKELHKLDTIHLSTFTDNTNDSLCEGETIRITVGTADAYSWTSIPFDSSIAPQTTNITIASTPKVDSIDTDIQYIATGTTLGCSISDTVDVFVKGTMSLSAGPYQSVCQDSSVILNQATGSGGRIDWYDNGANGTFLPDSNTLRPVYELDPYYDINIFLYASMVDTFGLCPTLLDTIILSVSPKPFMAGYIDTTHYCSLDSIHITTTTLENNVFFHWTDSSSGGTFMNDTTDQNNVYFPNPVVDNKDLCLTAIVRGAQVCEDYDSSICFYVHQAPIARFNFPPYVCLGEEVPLNDTVAHAAGDNKLFYSLHNGILDTGDVYWTHTYRNTSYVGFDTIVASITTTSDLCDDAYAEGVIEVKGNPDIQLEYEELAVCINEPIEITASGVVEYKWYTVGTDTVQFDSLPSISEVPLDDVRYMLVGTDVFDCVDTIYTDVTIKPNPEVDIVSVYDENECYPMEVEFSYDKSEIQVSDVFWNFADGHGSALDAPSHVFKKNPSIDYPHTYPVTLQVTYENGCIQFDTTTIIVCEDFDLPNVFTPHSSPGQNDNFVILGLSELEGPCGLTVYDRWGEKVFESTDYQNDWYGENNVKKNPKPLNSDTYFYVFACAGEVTWSGWVRIVTQKK